MTRMLKVREHYIFLLIFFLACLFRIVNFNVVPLFSDTANYARISAEIAEGDYWLTGPNASDKPPVYFYVQALIFAIFGVHETVALISSFIAGLLSVLLVYVLCKNLHGQVAGRWSALMMAVSPTATEMSVLGLVDGLLVTTILWSLWLLSNGRFFWGGLVIGLAFGIKQTTLVFGPLYLYWIIICTTQQKSTKKNYIIKSLTNSAFGFGIIFLPILYWSIFLAEQRLKIFADILWRLGIVERVSGHGAREFEGDFGWRIVELADRFSQMIGISWHFIIPIFFIGIFTSLGRIIKTQIKGSKTSFIYDWINIGIFGFVVLYLYVYIFHLNKLGGIAYLYPIFPLIIITIAFLLADLNVNDWSLNSKIFKNYFDINWIRVFLSWLIGVTIFFLICNASISSIRKKINFNESLNYQEIDSVANRLREKINSKSMIFANEVRWGLDFYLRDVKYRSKGYYLEENLEDMKSLLKTEPYTDFYILFYKNLFYQIEQVRKELTGQFVLKPEFESTKGNFRFFKVVPDFSNQLPPIGIIGDSWNQDWELWTKERMQKQWNPKTLKIKTQKTNKTGELELLIHATQTPLGAMLTDQVEIFIKNPVMNVKQSIFYKWPIFKRYDEISIHYVIRDKTLENVIKTKHPQIQNIVIQTSEKNIGINISGEFKGNYIEILSHVSLAPKNDYTDINILDIQVNEWSLTWLTQLFRNRLIKPLKTNRLHFFDSNLINVSGKSGVNNLYFQGLK